MAHVASALAAIVTTLKCCVVGGAQGFVSHGGIIAARLSFLEQHYWMGCHCAWLQV